MDRGPRRLDERATGLCIFWRHIEDDPSSLGAKSRILGMGVGLAEPLPEKPRGMWTRTYARLLNGILESELLADEAQVERFQRLSAQLQADL